MSGSPAPEVVEFLSCKCASDCKLPTCQCLANELKCTITCKTQDWNNWQEENGPLVDLGSDEGSDDEGTTEIAVTGRLVFSLLIVHMTLFGNRFIYNCKFLS